MQIAPALSILTKLVFSLDDEVLIDACWAVSYLSDGSNDKIQAVIESGVVRRLVELLMHSQTAVQTPALRSVGNIVTGDDLQTQVVITSGALPALLSLLSSPKEAIRKEACVAVTGMRLTSQLLDDQQHHRRLACADPVGHRCVAPLTVSSDRADANVVPVLVNVLQNADFRTKKEAGASLLLSTP